MNESTTLPDKDTAASLGWFKFFLWMAVGIAIGAAVYLVVLASIKERNLNNADIESQASDKGSNGLSHEPSVGTENDSGSGLNDPALDINAIQRFAVVYSFVGTLPDESLVETLERTINDDWINSFRVRTALRTALLERLVLVAPATALEFALAQQHPIRSQLVNTVFSEWASTDLETSLEKIADLPEPLRIVALKEVIEAREELPLARIRDIGLALNIESLAVSHRIESMTTEYIDDPKSNWYELIAIPEAETELGYEVTSRIAHRWYQIDGIEVLQEILNSEAGEHFQRNSINLILESITRKDPSRAFEYARDIPKEGAFQMFPPTLRVVFVWAELDPFAALEAVKAVEPSGMRDRLQNTAVNSWARDQPPRIIRKFRKFTEGYASVCCEPINF